MSKGSQPPERQKVLYDHLFNHRTRDESLAMISLGIGACASNSARLLEDAKLLVDMGSYASATFLATTAREEIAKCYILIDACRLDLSRHQSVLRRLCHAFYDHIAKHAYYEIHRFPKVRTMEQVKQLWMTEVILWWPGGGPESGEPDMPHDTYFHRELPIYVDFSDYSETWIIPENSSHRSLFDEAGGLNVLASATEMLDRIKRPERLGLFDPECLSILNDTFRKLYIREGTPPDNVSRLERRLAERIEEKRGIPGEETLNSPITGWPLYHFV